MIGIFVENLQNRLIALIAKLSKIIFSPVTMSVPRLTLENIEDKNVDKLMSIELYKYNISKHLNQVGNINYVDKYRINYAYRNYILAYILC